MPSSTVLTCKPCERQPTSPARAKGELSTLERARTAAAKLTKTSTPRARAEESTETADANRRASTPQTPTLKERPFGSTFEKAKQRADELRAMRRIGEALQALDTVDTSKSKSPTFVPYNKSVPTSLRNTYNSFSVYTSKLSSGNFGDILDPVPDLVDDDSDLEESSSLEKGGES